MTLDQARAGQWVWIGAVAPDAPGRRRLMEMGLTVGTPARLCGRAPFGDPVWLYIRGAYLTMRASQARAVSVRPLPGRP